MKRLLKFIERIFLYFFVFASIITSFTTYAAVVNIADTPFSSRSAIGRSASDSSHTSTGVGGTVCAADAVDSASECNTLLGIDDAVATSCDGGKFNCSCPAEYSHSCVVGTCASCERKFKSCSQYQSCDTIIGSYNGGGVEVDSVAECQTIQGQDFYKALNCTNGAGENKFACIFPSCDDLQTQTYREYNNPSQAGDIAAGGVMSTGSRWKNGVRYSHWYCDTAVYTTDEEPARMSGSVSPIKPTCTNGTVLKNCALGSSVGISAYYCACPKDYEGNDLYNVTCPAGTYGAGRTCQEGGNIIEYEFCLPKCDTSSPRKVTGNPVVANCENVSQRAADEKLGSYVCASKSGDAYTAATVPTATTCIAVKKTVLSTQALAPRNLLP